MNPVDAIKVWLDVAEIDVADGLAKSVNELSELIDLADQDRQVVQSGQQDGCFKQPCEAGPEGGSNLDQGGEVEKGGHDEYREEVGVRRSRRVLNVWIELVPSAVFAAPD